MPVEEITLWAPGEAGHRDAENDAACTRVLSADSPPVIQGQLQRRYREITRERDRFALTDRGRRRRREAFDVTMKSLIKQAATEASQAIPDRPDRLDARIRIYAIMTELTSAVVRDHESVVRRGRKSTVWGACIGAAGLLAFVITLIVNGWIPLG